MANEHSHAAAPADRFAGGTDLDVSGVWYKGEGGTASSLRSTGATQH